jgi:hypothetical protein
MTLPPPNVCRLIAQLHALIGSPAAKEAENAREKLVQLLTKQCCSWNDLPEILAAVRTNDPATTNDATSPQPEGTAAEAMATHINIFDLIVRLIEKYVAVSDDERIAIALRSTSRSATTSASPSRSGCCTPGSSTNSRSRRGWRSFRLCAAAERPCC